MKIHKKIEQRTDEWFKIRAGKLTASNAQAIATNGKGLETYIYSLLAEKYSKNTEHYTNADMERGIELEESARMTYEIENEKVEEVGFIEMDEYTGCSPDGLIGKDGMIEIKCMNDPNHFRFILDRKIDSKWQWQMQMQMLVAERDYCILATYNQNFDKSLITVKIEKDMVMQEKLLIGISKGIQLIKSLEKQYAKRNL